MDLRPELIGFNNHPDKYFLEHCFIYNIHIYVIQRQQICNRMNVTGIISLPCFCNFKLFKNTVIIISL